MPELKFAAARAVRKGEGPPAGPSPLHKVSYHLQAALEEMRLLPIAPLAREQYYTWIYQLTAAASDLVIEDGHYPETFNEPERPDEEALRSDLKDILG